MQAGLTPLGIYIYGQERICAYIQIGIAVTLAPYTSVHCI